MIKKLNIHEASENRDDIENSTIYFFIYSFIYYLFIFALVVNVVVVFFLSFFLWGPAETMKYAIIITKTLKVRSSK